METLESTLRLWKGTPLDQQLKHNWQSMRSPETSYQGYRFKMMWFFWESKWWE